jgi:uncharacterized protein YhdP
VIEALSVTIEDLGDAPPRVLWFDAALRDIGIQQIEAVPGFSGLTGIATGTREGGTLWINSQDLVYRDDRLFREPLHFDAVAGEAAWRYEEGRLNFSSEDIRIENDDLALTARLGLARSPDEPAPVIDLTIAVNRCELAVSGATLPARVMSKTGVDWLNAVW